MPRIIPIPVPQRVRHTKIPAIVVKTIRSLGLRITLHTELKSYPGSTHWHVKHPGATGTLELTWWPDKRKLWMKVHANREATWMAQVTPDVKRILTLRLKRLR
jgi:hypothetical protein